MPPDRIMFIRHAEKPEPAGSDAGITPSGVVDDDSLTIRGWQRAGALAHLFGGPDAATKEMRPAAIFAAAAEPADASLRPVQTVTPLAAVLKLTLGTDFVTKYPKESFQPLISDVLSRSGTVLVSWEHKLLADLIRTLPNAPPVPAKWRSERFDLIWMFVRQPGGWAFSQVPQMLLAGDRADPIV